ncbi:MAG: leucine-rich repeat domain-containing protein, partial [Ruminococcus sp.]|nr:leucine-rich repeat domain-containing protein [Ruminococcus sp.]
KYLGTDTYVKIPETLNGLTVRAIDDYAFTTFWGDNDNTTCDSIVSVDIPATVEKIGYMAFYRCNSLKIVNLPNSDVNISACAFDDTPFMREIAGDSDVIIVNNILLKVKNFNGDYTVPDGVVNIAGRVFEYSCDISSVTIPSSVKRLSDYALQNSNWSNKSLVNLKSVTINGGVTDIGYNCFADCANLESVKLPNGVKTIDAYAFSGCEKLSDIDIPASVETIGNNAFQKSAITDVTISAGAYIEDAFKDCHSLKTVTVNGDDAELRTGAFEGCENLSTVIFNGDSPSIQNGSYGDYYSNPFSTSVKIVAHSGSAAIRYAKTNGNPYEAADHMQFCLWIDGVPTGDIWYYSEGTDITVPEKLDNVTITSFTIYDDNVTSVHIPKDVERFWIRTQDTSKTLPDSLTVYCYEGSKAIESAKEQNIKYEVIKPAHTHSYTSKVTKQPTCTEDGVMTYSCECGDSYTETIPAKGHSFVSKTVAPTYDERGYTQHTCSVCGYSYKDNYKSKLERE